MFGGEDASTRLLQGVGCTLKPADGLYMCCELNQISLVQLVKAREVGTIDIQNADDAPLMVNRDDDLASGRAVAGDVAWKSVDIRHPLGLPLGPASAAYPFPPADAGAGRLALEGPQFQAAVGPYIKARPVDIWKFLPQKGGDVG